MNLDKRPLVQPLMPYPGALSRVCIALNNLTFVFETKSTFTN